MHGILVALLIALASTAAQDGHVRIEVRSSDGPVVNASVVVNRVSHRTDEHGLVALSLPAGDVEIVVAKDGFNPASASFALGPGESRAVPVVLEPQSAVEEHVTVSATRTGKRLEDQAMRVEQRARSPRQRLRGSDGSARVRASHSRRGRGDRTG